MLARLDMILRVAWPGDPRSGVYRVDRDIRRECLRMVENEDTDADDFWDWIEENEYFGFLTRIVESPRWT